DPAIHRVEAGVDVAQLSAGLGLNMEALIARRSRVHLDPRHNAVQPLADGAIGVVVERVHTGILKAAIRLDAVPALPDRRSALFDRIQPRWATLLIEQLVRYIAVAVAA